MDIKKTISTIFIVPTLKIDKDKLANNNFINGYVCDGRKEIQYENSIYLLFRPKDIDRFREFLDDEYDRTRAIIDDYDYEDGFVVVVYKLNEMFKKDFEYIKQGKYSKTSLEFQELFPKMITVRSGNFQRDELSLQWRVFNRTEDMVGFWEDKLGVTFNNEMEVWHGFDMENETLDMKNFKELV